MKDNGLHRPGLAGFADPVYQYILITAGILFLYISLGRYVQVLYESCLILPCLLFWGAFRERRTGWKPGRVFLLPLAMVAWFLILQIKRGITYDTLYNTGLFLAVYVFAFPLASALRDGDAEKALKIFAGAYLAAAAVFAVFALLLIFDCLPAFLAEEILWNGGRLEIIWHSNVLACYLMAGILFGITWLITEKAAWIRILLSVLLIAMTGMLALTSCRTVIILTGGCFGSLIFFKMIRKGRKWFIPGVIAVLIVTMVFYKGAMWLYQMNGDRLIDKYIQQYSEQIAPDSTEDGLSETAGYETEMPQPDGTAEEAEPPVVISDDGEISLKTDSGQGSLDQDIGTLNSRTYIWSAALSAVRESRKLQLWGIGDPGWYISFYNSFPIRHLHNSWLECLVGLGLVGFLLAVLFTVVTAWNCLVILCLHYDDVWKRNTALLTLCLMGASVLQSYLFYAAVRHHPIDFLFFLCAGYLVHWQEEDNRRILAAVRSKLPFLKQ